MAVVRHFLVLHMRDTSVGNSAHQICRAGKHVVVFLVRGPLYLVAVSRQGEPERMLMDQLKCLHAQIVCILTTGFERMFLKNPGYDSRRLLGGIPSLPAATLHVVAVKQRWLSRSGPG